MPRHPFRHVLIALLLPCVLILAGTTALAHVTADDMPDSVAEVEYSIYLEFKPNDVVIRNKLGMVYYRLKKLPQAQEEFTKVLKLAPQNYDALDGMGLVKAAQGEDDAAVGYHQQAIAVNGQDMAGYYHLGSALEKKGQRVEALAAYRTALARFTAQYPNGSDNKKITEFGETIRTAIRTLEGKK